MKQFLLIIFFIFNVVLVFGQHDSINQNHSKNTVYFEMLGNSIGYSLNYDRLLISSEKFKTAGRIGLSYFPPVIPPEHFIVMPIEISELILLGRKKHYFEIGAGLTLNYQLYQGNNNSYFGNDYINRSLKTIAVFRLGYRYQKENGGFFWKAGLTPLYEITNNNDERMIVPNMFGIAVGYTLRKK